MPFHQHLVVFLWVMLFVVGLVVHTAIQDHHIRAMQQSADIRHLKEWEMKTRIEEALAKQQLYRALELGYMEQFIDGTGTVYYRPSVKLTNNTGIKLP